MKLRINLIIHLFFSLCMLNLGLSEETTMRQQQIYGFSYALGSMFTLIWMVLFDENKGAKL